MSKRFKKSFNQKHLKRLKLLLRTEQLGHINTIYTKKDEWSGVGTLHVISFLINSSSEMSFGKH